LENFRNFNSEAKRISRKLAGQNEGTMGWLSLSPVMAALENYNALALSRGKKG
jgi:uncharacterized membrane protein